MKLHATNMSNYRQGLEDRFLGNNLQYGDDQYYKKGYRDGIKAYKHKIRKK